MLTTKSFYLCVKFNNIKPKNNPTKVEEHHIKRDEEVYNSPCKVK